MPEIVPWWEHLQLRDEIVDASGVVDDDIQMSLYKVVYSPSDQQPRYAAVDYFGEITHPTAQLTELLTRVAIRLAGEPGGDHLVRLDQSMGGGKSHACIGAYHLATSPTEFWETDIGQHVLEHAHDILGRELPRSLGAPHVVVLSCDNMTPGQTDPAPDRDGPVAQSLYERFLWRLVSGDMQRYDRFSGEFGSKAAISQALQSVDKPVLIVIDEIINYIGHGLGGVNDPALTNQDMAFLRALTEAVKDTPKVAMLVVMISTDKDTTALDAEGQARRDEFERDLSRNGRALPVNENADFAAILRRRLFTDVLDEQAVTSTILAYQEVMADEQWQQHVFGRVNAPWVKRFAEQTRRTYPFHPQLMALAEQEWANLVGFQKVRDTIRIFAAGVYALSQRAACDLWVPLLIGPGDIPLSDAPSREALLNSGLIGDPRTATNYRSLAQNDIVDLTDTSGTARLLDTERKSVAWSPANPRAAERAATAIFLMSIVGPRQQKLRGAAETEVRAATAVPTSVFKYADADGVVRELLDPERGLTTIEVVSGRGGQQPRYFMSTRQRLQMLVRAMRNAVTDAERDAAITDCVDELLKSGPFQKAVLIRHESDQTLRETLASANLDQPRVTRLAALDPTVFTARNGEEAATRDAVEAALGLGDQAMPVAWASSLVFAVASTHGRAQARGLAADYVAHQRVIETTESGEEEQDFLRSAGPARDAAQTRLKAAVERAFNNVFYLAQPDDIRMREHITLANGQSALHGDDVWAALAHRQKAFPRNTFSVQALLYNLRDQDYGRPLPEIRDAFWNAPRLPLLPGGEADLRQALYDAVHEGKLAIVRGDGEEVAVTHPNEINLSSQNLKLQHPVVEDTGRGAKDAADHKGEDPKHGSDQSDASDTKQGGPVPQPKPKPPTQKQLSFVINKNLSTDPDSSVKLGEFLRALWVALDNGEASYILAQMQVVVGAGHAEPVIDKARELGVSVRVTDR